MEQILNMFGGFPALLSWGISYVKNELPSLDGKLKTFAADKLEEGKIYSIQIQKSKDGEIWVNLPNGEVMTAIEAIEHILELVENNKEK